MSITNLPKFLLTASATGLLLFHLFLSGAQAEEDHEKHCFEMTGPFSSVLVQAPVCTSPVGLCTHGVLGGPMDGASYDFTVYTLTPDANNPHIVVATGKSVITTKKGRMLTNDVSVMQFSGPLPTDPVTFVTTATIASGTQSWTHVSGQFVATGVLVLATGNATGTFTADLCRQDSE